ncbi:MAG: acetyl-CoA carboxylase biotin carboxylase subunit [bacterium]|jgi:acetyl-CoA carboxylase biotin carboxylase subunit
MFDKILIANRGEIALRIIRACREMGIRTVAVYSQPDRNTLPVREADEAYCIGPAAARQSYLNIANIITAGKLARVDAIHPGYGFLAENPYFAEMCETSGMRFIGPPAQVIARMGDKAAAREAMAAAGLPVVPGSRNTIRSEAEAAELAAEIGYPVLIKAAAGGGGRGMRIAHNQADLSATLATAQTEASAAFGSADVYIEKYIEEPRHIEVQIMADAHGNIASLGERDCSLQRRHQKLIEETPAPNLEAALRVKMAAAAVQAAQTVGYASAGTVEFLVDRQGGFYFIEMNTRIQVEHAVTEMVTGLDLIKEQIMTAAGAKLSFAGKDIRPSGWAIECRINAEDAENDFRPATGLVREYTPPGGPGVRIDSALFNGYSVSPFYDSLLAKVAVWGRDREEAVVRMRRALWELRIEGVKTTLPFQRKVINNAFFQRGEVYTNFIQRRIMGEE